MTVCLLVRGTDLARLYSRKVQGPLVTNASLSCPYIFHSFDGKKNFLLVAQTDYAHVF